MRNVCFRKGLVVGIIILFLGAGFQPAIADVSNIYNSDSEDDCDICPKVSKQHIVRIKSLIDRLDTLNTKLSKVSKLNPELEDKYQELSKSISTFKNIYKELKQVANKNKNTDLCDSLQNVSLTLMLPYFFYIGLISNEGYPIIKLILFPFVVVTTTIGLILMAIWKVFCYKAAI